MQKPARAKADREGRRESWEARSEVLSNRASIFPVCRKKLWSALEISADPARLNCRLESHSPSAFGQENIVRRGRLEEI